MPAGTKGYTEDDYARALEANAGIYLDTAKALKVSRQAVREWVLRSKRLQAICAEARERVTDIAEGHVLKAIKKGEDTSTVRWWLERQAKHRGYVTRVENTGKGGGPIQTVDLSKLSTAELVKLEALLAKAEGEG